MNEKPMNEKDEAAVVREAFGVLLGDRRDWLPDPSGGDTSTMAGQIVQTHVPPRVAFELRAALDSLITQRNQALAEVERLRAALEEAEPVLDRVQQHGLSSCEDARRSSLLNADQHSAGCTVEKALSALRQALATNTRETP